MDSLSISAYLCRGFEVELMLYRHIQMEQVIVLSTWDPIEIFYSAIIHQIVPSHLMGVSSRSSMQFVKLSVQIFLKSSQ